MSVLGCLLLKAAQPPPSRLPRPIYEALSGISLKNLCRSATRSAACSHSHASPSDRTSLTLCNRTGDCLSQPVNFCDDVSGQYIPKALSLMQSKESHSGNYPTAMSAFFWNRVAATHHKTCHQIRNVHMWSKCSEIINTLLLLNKSSLRVSQNGLLVPHSFCRLFSSTPHNNNIPGLADAGWISGEPNRLLDRRQAPSSISSRSMAGHSKWQNIRHIKAAKDGQRSNLFSRLAIKIKIAVREGGGDDPKFNNQLARVLSEAKSKDMPNSSISTAIKIASAKEMGSLQILELKGPGPCLWLVEVMTDKPRRTKGEVGGVVKKHGCSVSDGNTVIRAFMKRGVIQLDLAEGQDVNMDKYLEVAIETGAEDVEERTDEDGVRFLALVCDFNDLHAVKKAVEGRELPVKSAYVEYVARSPAVLAESDVANLQVILNKLYDHAEVLRVFDNIQVAET